MARYSSSGFRPPRFRTGGQFLRMGYGDEKARVSSRLDPETGAETFRVKCQCGFISPDYEVRQDANAHAGRHEWVHYQPPARPRRRF